MNALVLGRLLLFLAIGLALAGLVAAGWDVWYGAVLFLVAVLYAGAGWLAVESHRSVQEWMWRERVARNPSPEPLELGSVMSWIELTPDGAESWKVGGPISAEQIIAASDVRR